MSAYSTLVITRSKALEVWLSEQAISLPSDEELEVWMDEYLEPRLYNCCIIDREDEYNDNDAI